ncbi:MAG: alpha/beta fold hydrolase [Rhizobiaceae bacterium]
MKAKKILKWVLKFWLRSFVIFFTIALGLIVFQWPVDRLEGATIDFSQQTSSDLTNSEPLDSYAARDGEVLGYRHYPAANSGSPLMIFIHGSGWHGLGYDGLAQALSKSGNLEIVVPDLRGHGPNPTKRGDINYIGQLEDDLFDLISQIRKPGQKLIIAGHSSGGGLAIRFAGGQYGHLLDGAVLLSPFLKYDAPTMRENAGGWARPLTRRIIGFSMLNIFNITQLNGMTAIQFNFPETVLNGALGNTATTSYSYRMNTSFAPRFDYLSDIEALPQFVLIAGTKDESFFAEEFEPLMSQVTSKGSYELLEGVSHLEVVNNQETVAIIGDFLAEMN